MLGLLAMCGGSLIAVEADAGAGVEICEACHGHDGASTLPDVPILGGQSATYIASAMNSYRSGRRPCREAAASMCRIAADLDPRQVVAIARMLAGKPFVRAIQPVDQAKATEGRKLHERYCERCHTQGGSSKADDVGILAGQYLPYLQRAFAEFEAGSRPMPKLMKSSFDELSASQQEALLQFYGSGP